MMTRELLKKEIDNVRDEYLLVLFRIIKAFEHSNENGIETLHVPQAKKRNKAEWRSFLENYAGSLAETPIERGDQGKYEQREAIL